MSVSLGDRFNDRQLAVVQGLVMDRIQAISRGNVVFKERCCRISYGTICREPYDKFKHTGEKVTYDSRDRKQWAEGQIDWFVKQVTRRPVYQCSATC